METIQKNYLAYVCSYFHLGKKIQVRKELTQEMADHLHEYDSVEDMLIHFGHPKSLAYTMGYRPILTHQFHPDLQNAFTYTLMILFDLFLLLSSYLYLAAFGYINAPTLFAKIVNHQYLSLLFEHPFVASCILFSLVIALFVIRDNIRKDKVEEDLSWNKEKLYAIPSYRTYSHHLYETILMGIMTLFFIAFGGFFISNVVSYNTSAHATIDVIFYFIQPYVAIIYLSYFLDLTKRNYTKGYLILSFITNLLTFIPVNIAVIQSKFLTDFMLPVRERSANSVINTFVVSAVILIEVIIIFKLIKNAFNMFRLYLSTKTR